jgi:hypothetical protein
MKPQKLRCMALGNLACDAERLSDQFLVGNGSLAP